MPDERKHPATANPEQLLSRRNGKQRQQHCYALLWEKTSEREWWRRNEDSPKRSLPVVLAAAGCERSRADETASLSDPVPLLSRRRDIYFGAFTRLFSSSSPLLKPISGSLRVTLSS